MRRLLAVLLLLVPCTAGAWVLEGTQINSPGFWTFERDGTVTSSTAEFVTSPSVQVYLPAGTVTSSSNSGDPAMWGITLPSATSEIYIQVWIKYKSNFDFHAVANKLIYIYNAAHQPMFVIDGPTPPGDAHLRPWVGAPFGSRALFPNLTETPIVAGTWYKLLFHINVSTGLFEYWVNDVKNGYYTDVTLASAITEVNFTPVWGGTGDTGPSVGNYQWYDDAYISNTTAPGGTYIPPVEEPADPGTPTTTWTIAWQDEFDQAGCTTSAPCYPNDNNWNYEVGYKRNGNLAYTTDRDLDNARVENGRLIIEARKEDYLGDAYTSATLISLGKVDFYQGRLEVRMAHPNTTNAINSAAWLFGKNRSTVGWPNCGEIDLVEYVPGSYWGPNRVSQGFHTLAYYGENSVGDYFFVSSPWDFHTYAYEWSTARIDLYIDGVLKISKVRSSDPNDWPYDLPFYFLLGINVSDEWGAGGIGTVDPSGFPVQMVVEFVRYYTLSQGPPPVVPPPTGITVGSGFWGPYFYGASLN